MWKRLLKPNPAYKGAWKPPVIDNPAYKVCAPGEREGEERSLSRGISEPCAHSCAQITVWTRPAAALAALGAIGSPGPAIAVSVFWRADL